MNDYRARKLQMQQEQRELDTLTQLVKKYISDDNVEEYVEFIFEELDYQRMTLGQIIDTLQDFVICSQCGEITQQDYMVNTDESVGGGYGDVCDWCWGNK